MAAGKGCELFPSGATNTSGISGAVLTLDYDLSDMGGCVSETLVVTVSSNNTGGTLISSSSFIATPGTGTVTYQLGDLDGSDTVNVNCAGCATAQNVDLTFDTANVYTLDFVTPASGQVTAQPGETVTVTMKAQRNGVPYTTSVPVDYTDTSGIVFSPASPNSDPVTGEATTTFTAPAEVSPPDYYYINGFYCVPGSGCDLNASKTATVIVAKWQFTTFAGTGTDPFVYEKRTVSVKLFDANTDPVVGQTINFSLPTAPAGTTLDTASATTDASGVASVILTTGANSGPLTLQADLASDPTVTWSWTPSAGVKAITTPGLAIVQGDGQSDLPGATLPTLLKVHATNDSGGSAEGAPVTWSVTSGTATLDTGTNTSTDSSGHAAQQVTFGSTPGAVQIQADFLGTTQTFNLTINDDYTLVATSATTASLNLNEVMPIDTRYKKNTVGADADVSFTATGGTLGAAAVTPDSVTGDANTTFSASSAGSYTITAHGNCPTALPDCPPPDVVFTANVVDRTLSEIAGNYQSGPKNTALPIQLKVQALDDGVPAVGVTIHWDLAAGSDGSVSSPTSITDASGYALMDVTLGSTPGGMVDLDVYRDDNTSATVSFYEYIDSEFLLDPVSPTSVSIGVGQTTTLTANYTYNGSASSNDVTWTTTGGSLSNQVPINASGDSSIDFSANTAGVYTITANGDCPIALAAKHGAGIARAGQRIMPVATSSCPPTPVTFTVTVVGRALIGGGTAEGAPNRAFLLTVRAEDDGSPVSGKTIHWTSSGNGSLAGSSSVTDGSGNATMTATLGSNVGDVLHVTATRADDSTATASFTLTAVAPQLSIVAGNGQSGVIGSNAATDLEVELRDGTSSNLPLAGEQVVWHVVSGPAVLAATSATTDSNGRAKVGVSFGATVGASVIEAADSAGLSSVRFNLDTVDQPTLSIVEGDGQSGVSGSAGDVALKVRLVDALAKSLPGQTIDWQVVSGSINLQSASSVTDADGYANMPFSYGATLGDAVVQASDGVRTAQFHLSVIGGGVGKAPLACDISTGEVGKPLPCPLKIRISGTSATTAAAQGPGKPRGLAGVPVHWAVTAGGGSLSASDTVTDANGESEVDFTLGPNPGVNSVTATTPGGTVVFESNAVYPSGTLVRVSGNNQDLPTNTESDPLVVELRNGAGQPLAGITLSWTADNASLDHASTVTDANGRASVVATVTEPGAATVSVSSDNPAAGPIDFSLNGGVANLPNLTQLQEQVAEVIDELCPALAALDNLTPEQEDLLARCRELVDATGIDPDSAIIALDELFTDLAVAETNASILSLQSQFQNLKARIAALRSGAHGGNFGGLTLAGPGGFVPLGNLFTALAGEAEPEVGADFSRWGWFVTGTIGRGESDPTSVNPAYDFDINGLTGGVDYRYSDKLIIGGSLGFTRQDTDARNGAGTLDTSGWSLSAYGTWYQENSWYFDGVLTLGRNSYDSTRPIDYTLPLVGGGSIEVSQTARASSSGNLMQSAFTFGRDFQKGGWSLGAYSRLLYSKVQFGQSEEQLDAGIGSGLGLVVKARDETSLATVLGGKASFAKSMSWGILMPHFELEWEREARNDAPVIEAYFAADPTQSAIRIYGEQSDRSYFRMGFGLSMVLQGGKSGFFYYERMLGREGMSQDNLSLGFRMEF